MNALRPAVIRYTFAESKKLQNLRTWPASFLSVLAAVLLALTSLTAEAQTAVHFSGTTAVGSTATTVQHVPITLQLGGFLSGVKVFTQGVDAMDFTNAGGAANGCNSGLYVQGQICYVDVAFRPSAPGRRKGSVVLISSQGGVIGSRLVDGVGAGPLQVIRPGEMESLAGTSNFVYNGDGIPATTANLYSPFDVLTNAKGDIFLADSVNNRIRRISAADQTISTYAGGGSGGTADGAATDGTLSLPVGLAMDGAGNLYISEHYNHAVRRVDAVTGQMTTFAGTYVHGYSGVNGPATSAQLNFPSGIALDREGNLYIADTSNNAIRRVDAVTKIITTIAGGNTTPNYSGDGGPASAAQLSGPWAVAFAPDGVTLYIADSGNAIVRKMDISATNPTIQAVAGTGIGNYSGDGGPALSAQLQNPSGLAFDPIGNLYIADTQNNRIRRVDATTGNITTIAGTGAPLFQGDGINADQADLKGPYGLHIDALGNLLIGDVQNNHLRRVRSNFALLSYPVMKVGKKSTPQMETVENDGNTDLHLGTPVFDQSALDAATTTCGATAISPNGTCVLGIQFAPRNVSQSDTDTIVGSLAVPSDAVNSPDRVQVSGHVLSVEPTNLTLTSNINPASPSQAVTFTASVTTLAASISGEVDFYEGSTQLGHANLFANNNANGSSGTASITINTLSIGSHTITAVYQGDDLNAASNTGTLTEVILQPTQVSLTSSKNPSTWSDNVTFTATVTPTAGNAAVASGSVHFVDYAVLNGTAEIDDLGTVPVNASGVASLSTPNLKATEGSARTTSHSIVAIYSGNTTFDRSQSAGLNQVVHRIATTTTIAVAPTEVIYGATVSMTATVTPASGATPVGTGVGFYASTDPTNFNGALFLGQGTAVDANGQSTFSTKALAPGQNYVRAQFGGSAEYGTSNSSSIGVLVHKFPTVTTVSSSPNPANVGDTVTITANVAPASSDPQNSAPGGIVTFYDNGVQIGVVSNMTSGVAAINSTTLGVGTHPITAVYSESDYALGSSSAVYNQTVQKVAAQIALTLNSNNTIAGKPLTLLASVSGSSMLKATGYIVFTADGNQIGQSQLSAQAAATFVTSNLAVGTHSIVATYVGDSNFSSGQSAAATMTVRIGSTSLSLAASGTQLVAGSALTLSGSLTSDGVLASNAGVVLTDNGTVLATLTPNTSGAYTFNTSTLSVGVHTLVATYAGDANNAAAASQPITVTVSQARTTTTLTSSQSPSALGDNVNFRAVVTSSLANAGGTVTFSDGGSVLGTLPLSGTGDAVYSTSALAIGRHTLTATYSGDTTHTGSASAAVQQQVMQGTAAAMTSSSNPSIAGLPVDFAISVTANTAANGTTLPTPTGTVTVMDGTTALAPLTLNNGMVNYHATALTVGTHNLTVVYGGDVNFKGSTSALLVQVVKNADTHATLTASASQISLGTSLALNVTVTGNGSVPTGTITFLDGTTAMGTVPASSTGTAAFSTATLTPGMHNLTATYSGDSNNGPTVSAPVSVQVQQTSSVVLNSSSNPALTLDTITLSASVRNSVAPVATGTVQFTEGSAVLGVATLDGTGTALLKVGPFAAGVHNIVASYSGDVADYASASLALPITISLRKTTAAVTATAPTKVNGGQVSLISVLNYSGPVVPTGTVTFKNGTAVLGSSRLDGAGVATYIISTSILPANITSTYSGDTVYAGSTSGTAVIPVDSDATNFTITVDPIAITVKTKQFAVAKVAIHSNGGFADTLSLGCLGLPYAATCTFDKDVVDLSADGLTTVNVTIDTGSPLTSGGQTIQQKAALTPYGTKASKAALCTLPLGALCAIFLMRSRKRTRMASLLLLLVLAVLVLPMGGCGSIDVVSTPPGGYSFKISAAGKASGVTLSQTVNLTVTQ